MFLPSFLSPFLNVRIRGKRERQLAAGSYRVAMREAAVLMEEIDVVGK
jgi:hypothetical protein